MLWKPSRISQLVNRYVRVRVRVREDVYIYIYL